MVRSKHINLTKSIYVLYEIHAQIPKPNVTCVRIFQCVKFQTKLFLANAGDHSHWWAVPESETTSLFGSHAQLQNGSQLGYSESIQDGPEIRKHDRRSVSTKCLMEKKSLEIFVMIVFNGDNRNLPEIVGIFRQLLRSTRLKALGGLWT